MIAATAPASGGRSIGTSVSSRRRNTMKIRSAAIAATTTVMIAVTAAHLSADTKPLSVKPRIGSAVKKAMIAGIASGHRKSRMKAGASLITTGSDSTRVSGTMVSVPPFGTGPGSSAQLHVASDRNCLRTASTRASAGLRGPMASRTPVKCNARSRSRRIRSTDMPGVPVKLTPGLVNGVCPISTICSCQNSNSGPSPRPLAWAKIGPRSAPSF